jgi:hypothetical protein
MTLHPDDCLSMLELLEIRSGATASTEVQAHISDCPRCRVLLEVVEVPAADLDGVAFGELAVPVNPRAPVEDGGQQIKTGDLYQATGDQSHVREVVVVIGRVPERDDVYIVAPTSTALEQASDLDLIVLESPLGYPHLVCLWNQGQVFGDQLGEPLGRLDRAKREQLVSLHQAATGQATIVRRVGVGAPLQGRDDPRRIFQALAGDRLRLLYGPVDRSLEHLEDQRPLAGEEQLVGDLLAGALSSESWDISSLVEVARVSRSDLDRLRDNDLDLTDRRVVVTLAAVLVALEIPPDEAEEPVRATLARAAGGERVAQSGPTRLAARSYADIGEEQRARDLYRDLSTVDTSPPARRRAIERYWAELIDELEQRTT